MIIASKIDLEIHRVVSPDEGRALAEEYAAWFYELHIENSAKFSDVFIPVQQLLESQVRFLFCYN